MTNPPDSSVLSPRAAFVRIGGLSVAAAVGVAALGFMPTLRFAGWAGVTAMGVGVGIALTATLAGLGLVVRQTAGDGAARHKAILGSMLLRFVVFGALTLSVALGKTLPPAPLLIWAALGYLVLLAVDTAGVHWLFSSRTKA